MLCNGSCEYAKIIYLIMFNEDSKQMNNRLSAIIDNEENIYEVAKEIAGVAKRIKEEDKENPSPEPSVKKAINEIYEHKIS